MNGQVSDRGKYALLGVAVVAGAALIWAVTTTVLWQEEMNSNSESSAVTSACEVVTSVLEDTESLTEPSPRQAGQWMSVIPEANGAAISGDVGLQSIHTVLLPSGKILMVSGSSWRNRKPTETFPEYNPPAHHKGVHIKDNLPFANAELDEYYSIVNFNGIYDPSENTFFRVPHPVPELDSDPDNPGWFLPTDLFCCGHQHLPDGNVLFIGGTQYYTPNRSGAKTAQYFDWRKEAEIDWTQFDWTTIPTDEFNPWVSAGTMHRGRWYPHMVPLLDGRLVVFGGYVGWDAGFEDMYPYEMNHYIEIFDPRVDASADPQAAWKLIDVKQHPNSPFVTRLANLTSKAFDCTLQRQCDDYKNDTFKLYPQNYLLADGRIFVTHEGDWQSLREPDTACMRRSRHSYFMSVGGTRSDPEVSFEQGPLHESFVTSSGSSVWDPNDGQQILLFGGQVISGGTLMPGHVDANDTVAASDVRLANHYAGSRGTRKLEVYNLPSDSNSNGSWTILDLTALGGDSDFDRTMHYALILPTQELLIVGGGNYDFFGPVLDPLLLSPVYCDGVFNGSYRYNKLASHAEPRLYHNSNILLPDGRILGMSGNAARATIDVDADQADDSLPNPGGQRKHNRARVDLDLHFFTDSSLGSGQKGAPAENWFVEVFSPPYLFIDPNRRTVIENVTCLSATDFQPHATISGRPFALIHSNVTYRVSLSGLPDECPMEDGRLVMIKLPSVTHGWDAGQRLIRVGFFNSDAETRTLDFSVDAAAVNAPPAFYMLFYVDCRGKPTIAYMVRFDDSASSV